MAAARAGVLSDRWPEWAGAAALVLGWLLLRDMVLHHDPMWQLWIGRQLLHGAELYVDILEVNPPLWFWAAIPIAGLSEISGMEEGRILLLAFFGVMGASLALTCHLIRERRTSERAALIAVVLLLFVLLPLDDFGQREHFTLIAVVPYVALIARRMEGREVGTGAALAVGLLAAFGVALKHYFLLAPVALEILYYVSARRQWKLVRPEPLALLAVAAAYLAAILLAAPEFLLTMVPMIELAYGFYQRPLAVQLGQPLVPMLMVGAAAIWLWRGLGSPLARAALAASIAFAVAYFLQSKGWRYHTIPAAGLLALALVAEIAARLRRPWRCVSGSDRIGIAAALAALAFPLAVSLAVGTYSNSFRGDTERALAGAGRGESVLVLAINASAAWPMVEERKLIWPSRHFTFWMLPSIARAEQEGTLSPELAKLAEEVRAQTAADMECHPPSLILVDTLKGAESLNGVKLDTLGFFSRNPRFAELVRGFRPGGEFGRFLALRRTGARAAPPPARGCRKIY